MKNSPAARQMGSNSLKISPHTISEAMAPGGPYRVQVKEAGDCPSVLRLSLASQSDALSQIPAGSTGRPHRLSAAADTWTPAIPPGREQADSPRVATAGWVGSKRCQHDNFRCRDAPRSWWRIQVRRRAALGTAR